MFFNIISILTCNKYDLCFNAVAHIYTVFPGIINTYHPGQNIWKEVKKSSKIGQYQETLKSASV